MTAPEIREEFNLRFNNALEGAPGLDTFEISTYLTLSQEILVKKYYEDIARPGVSFEISEKARRMINELVQDEKVSDPIPSNRGLVPESKFYELSNDVMYIVMETVLLDNGEMIRVVPTTHDEFMVSYNNPFRKPNNRKAWRIDLSKENSKKTVEIISSGNIVKYGARYISYPPPIIVEDLTTASDVAGLGLSIQGKTAQAASVLSEMAVREIIHMAVESAVLDYRESTLQGRVQLDSRV